MDEITYALKEWFDAEHRLATVCDSGRTTHGSAYYRQCEQEAEYARERIARMILNSTK